MIVPSAWHFDRTSRSEVARGAIASTRRWNERGADSYVIARAHCNFFQRCPSVRPWRTRPLSEPVTLAPSTAESVSPVSALFGVFTEPRKTFEGLKEKAPWLFPMILVLLAVVAFTWVNWPFLMDERMEAIRNSDRIPAESKAQIMQSMQEQREHRSVLQMSAGPAFVAIFSLLGAGLWLMAGNVIMGGDGTYKKIWCVFNYASLVSLLEMGLKTLMIQMKQSAHVYTSLALLAPDLDPGGFLFRALDGVDVFSIWFFALMAIGVSVMCKVKPQKAMTVSFVIFGVWVLGLKAGLGSTVGQYMGM
jgi:hypothetical protein